MAKCEKVTMYRTGDGKVFPSEFTAEAHHKDLICEMFENVIKPLDVPSLKIADRDKICEALYAQRDHIAQYIQYLDVEN